MEGYIKLHRCLLENPIWMLSTPEQKTILITLLLMANHKESEWEWQGQKFKVNQGQFVTSLDSIAKKAGKGISIKNIRTALDRFEKLGFLANESTKTGRLITVVNWGLYQTQITEDGKETDKEGAKRRQTGGKQVATNKKDKKDKNDNNIYTPEFEEFYRIYPNCFNKQQTFKNWLSTIKSDTSENIMKATNNYIDYIKNKNTDKAFITRSTNFLGRDQVYKGYLEMETHKSNFDKSGYEIIS